jgi:FlaA1/EpsC-like NDP-sugar epimerase
MSTQRIRTIYTISLVILDAFLIAVAFVLAYRLRIVIDWPEPLATTVPLSAYSGLLMVQIISIVVALFFYRLYYIPRAVSRVDQFYYVFAAVSIGTLLAVALTTFLFKGDRVILDYPRAMIIYAWVITIVLLVLGRALHQMVRAALRNRGWGKDRLIVVGTGDMAYAVIQRILHSPYLGYELMGVVNGLDNGKEFGGMPISRQPGRFARAD